MHSHLNTVLVFKRSEVHVLPNRYRNSCTDTEYVMMSVNANNANNPKNKLHVLHAAFNHVLPLSGFM